MFRAVEKSPDISIKVNEILAKSEPITILVEGSAFLQNIDTLHAELEKRMNPDDQIILVDISDKAVKEHQEYVSKKYSGRKYSVIQADMNQVPLSDNSVDLVINDCAVNFNVTDEGNKRSLSEIKRVLKPNVSASLFSVAVDKNYDDPKFGVDQESVPAEQIDTAGFFYPLPDQSIQRLCWSVPYYKKLFGGIDLSYKEFDIEEGKTHFPNLMKISYRRFLLTKEEIS